MSNQLSSDSGPRSRAPEGIAIAAVPVVAFAFAFAYEAGYGQYFRIPLGLIRLDWTIVLLAAGGVFLLAGLLFSAIEMLYVVSGNRPRGRRALILSVLAIQALAYVTLFGSRWREYSWFLVGVATVLLLEYVLPLLTQRGKRPYREKLEAQDRAESRLPSLVRVFGERVGKETFLFLVFGFLALLLTFQAGRANAIRREQFPVLDRGPEELVILRFYDDMVIAAKLDRERSQVERSMLILTMQPDSQPLAFQIEQVGPLTPAPAPSGELSN